MSKEVWSSLLQANSNYLLKNLDYLCNEAIAKLLSLGYNDDVALKAILRNDYCYGVVGVLSFD